MNVLDRCSCGAGYGRYRRRQAGESAGCRQVGEHIVRRHLRHGLHDRRPHAAVRQRVGRLTVRPYPRHCQRDNALYNLLVTFYAKLLHIARVIR